MVGGVAEALRVPAEGVMGVVEGEMPTVSGFELDAVRWVASADGSASSTPVPVGSSFVEDAADRGGAETVSIASAFCGIIGMEVPCDRVVV